MANPIVVDVDGSPSSLDAVEVAAHEAGLRGRLVSSGTLDMTMPPHPV